MLRVGGWDTADCTVTSPSWSNLLISATCDHGSVRCMCVCARVCEEGREALSDCKVRGMVDGEMVDGGTG